MQMEAWMEKLEQEAREEKRTGSSPGGDDWDEDLLW